ncbi:MAG: galactose mutarotase [Endomicrobium sp.]|jgi:aldose 1-epimerase|nr:galactose mutarotase [Endomicrobium sp.]
MNCKKSLFGIFENQEVYLLSFNNDNGFGVECISYGATLKAIYFPRIQSNRDAENKSVVLGYDKLDDYIKDPYFLGSSIGRTAGRIKDACFKLDGEEYKIKKNDNNNLLHGGKNGFHSLVWEGQIINNKESVGVKFSRLIKSSDDMFPGNMTSEITYLLNNDNELEIIFNASSDKSTLFNPTNHAYFNLNLGQENNILNHYLTINAYEYLETNNFLVPTGNRIRVENSGYDFTKERLIGESFKVLKRQGTKGLDTPFCLIGGYPAAVLKNADKTRTVAISTDRNCMVVYTSTYFDNKHTINGMLSNPYMGIALEAQTLPDAIHHENFGSTVMREGETKGYKTVIKMCQCI